MTEPAELKKTSKNFGLLTDVAALAKLADGLLAKGKPVGFDLETGYHGPDFEKRSLDVDHPDQFVCGFSLSGDESWARYVPLAHDYANNCPRPDLAWEAMGPLLTKGIIVAHNAKFEHKNVLKAAGYRIGSDGGTVRDSMLDAYVLSEFGYQAKGAFGLKDLVEIIFAEKMTHIQELFPGATEKQLKCLRFNPLQLTPKVVGYCCDDAAWCLALLNHYGEKAEKERGDMQRLEHRIMEIMVDVENKGVEVDWEGLAIAKAQSDKFVPLMEKAVVAGLEKLAGRSLVNLKLNSTPQMRKLLYEEIGMTTTRVSQKTGQKSTDAIAMEGLSKKHPEIRKLLDMREVANLNSRIATWITDYQGSWDHRVHANYNQVKVGTGRFAAEDPPIQQLPKDWRWTAEMGFDPHSIAPGAKEEWEACKQAGQNGIDYWTGNFRDFVIAAPGHYFLTYDYSQIELRVLAGVTGEPELLRAFAEDKDVHTLTAALMLGKRVEDVDPDVDRPVGKAQPLDSSVLTPSGWRRFGDLVVGDEVIGSDGQPTKVTGVFPQGTRPVYRVITSDGAEVECCEEHLWTVRNKNSGGSACWQTRSLRYLMDHGLRQEQGKYAQPKYELPPRPVVQYAQGRELLMDPYVMGLLLGDGGMTHGSMPSFSSEDQELLDAVEKEVAAHGSFVSSRFTRGGEHPGFYVASSDRERARGAGMFRAALEHYGVWGVGCYEKSVPGAYMLASPEDRLAVLQGLLDTDGNVVMGMSAQFRVTSKQLALDCQELVRSLGGFASFKSLGVLPLSEGYGVQRHETWAVHLSLPNGMNPFRLSRKAAQIRERRRNINQRIFRVEGGDASEVQCISVASEDGLYVSSAYVVTHNTMNFA